MSKPVKVVSIDLAKRTQKVAEYHELKRLEAVFAPHGERLTQLREEIQTWYPEKADDEPVNETYGDYILQLGPRQNEREIVSMSKLFNQLGKTTFLKLCRFPLTVIDQIKIDPQILKVLVIKLRTGARRVTTVAANSSSEAA